MALLPIYVYGSEILKKKTTQFKDINDSTVKLLIDIFETLKNANGMGLAANQVGIPLSFAAFDLSSIDPEDKENPYEIPEEFRKTFTLFNPVILKSYDEYTMEEGCLSIPEIRSEVTRPETIKVKFRDADFNERIIDANGILSRVIQHEIDHLNGKLFIEHLGKIKVNILKPKLNKIKKGKMEFKYPIVNK